MTEDNNKKEKQTNSAAKQARLKLRELLDNCFIEKDIDDQIENEWLDTFQRIDDELADINNTVSHEKIFVKKSKDIKENFKENFFSMDRKLVTASLIVLLFISIMSNMIPESSRQVELEKIALNKVEKNKDISKKLVDKINLSEYIRYNQENLKTFKNKGINKIQVYEEDIFGRVAGVSEEINNKELLILDVKKSKIKYFFAYLKLLLQ